MTSVQKGLAKGTTPGRRVELTSYPQLEKPASIEGGYAREIKTIKRERQKQSGGTI
jgi:hypothetical protein